MMGIIDSETTWKEEKYDQGHKDPQGTEVRVKERRSREGGRPALKEANNNSRTQSVQVVLELRQLVETNLACSHQAGKCCFASSTRFPAQ